MNTYENDEYVENLAAVFIDMLGVSEEINKAKNRTDVENIAFKIKSFYENFDYKIEPEGFFTQESFNFSDCKTLFFDFNKNNFSLALTHLDIIAKSQLECVKQGIFIRGGISFGYRFRQNDLFISKAFVESAKLEASINFPIIAVSDDMTNLLKSKPINYLLLINTHDIDNSLTSRYFLNYLTCSPPAINIEKIKYYKNKYSKCSYLPHYYFYEYKEIFKNHKSQIEKALLSINNKSIIAKYDFLKKYHNWAIDYCIKNDFNMYRIDESLISEFKNELSF